MTKGTVNILDSYVSSMPTAEAFMLFDTEWSSKVPGAESATGKVPLFTDSRITWAREQLNGFEGKRILELGPLEGGHTYMLSKGGAKEVVSIESNTRSFLKSLIVGNYFQLKNVKFLLGDFRLFLANTDEKFDAAFASGVLYHMPDPLQLLRDMSRVTDQLYIWTHYYDEATLAGHNSKSQFVEKSTVETEIGPVTLNTRLYGSALGWGGFCGGSADYANWLERDVILEFLKALGFSRVVVAHDDKAHPNGPCFSVCASRS